MTIFDLPRVVRMSREHFVSEADLRINFQQGNIMTTQIGHRLLETFTVASVETHTGAALWL